MRGFTIGVGLDRGVENAYYPEIDDVPNLQIESSSASLQMKVCHVVMREGVLFHYISLGSCIAVTQRYREIGDT